MNRFFAFLIAFLMCGITYAQQYVPFPSTPGVKWTVKYTFNTCEEGMLDSILFQCKIGGDTSINGLSYHKLMMDTGATPESASQLIGCLREDNKRVYYRGLGNSYSGYGMATYNQEVLLYDFNANVGDTIIHAPTGTTLDGWPESVINSIDSVRMIDGTYRKHYSIGGSYMSGDWIEGIGNIATGLLGQITGIPNCGVHIYEYVCFSENGIPVYMNPKFSDCEAAVPFDAIDDFPAQSAIKIYPNPAPHEVHIDNISPADNIQIKVVDYTGRVIMVQDLKQQNNTIKLPASLQFCIIALYNKKGTSVKVQKLILN